MLTEQNSYGLGDSMCFQYYGGGGLKRLNMIREARSEALTSAKVNLGHFSKRQRE